MSIQKYYEISCDWCRCGCYYTHNIKYAEECFREDGGLIKKGKHFCTKECYDKFKKENSNFPEK